VVGARDDAGLDALVARPRAAAPALVVLEATGGLEIPVAAALAGEVLALFAERARPEPRPAPAADARLPAELVARRRQLVDMITAEGDRRR
jgi:transposase